MPILKTIEVFMVPSPGHPKFSTNRSFESTLRLFDGYEEVDGLTWFNPN